MKKRIVCALLAMILLLSLVPVTASAAGMNVSESAITVLKQLETYRNECYHVSGNEYRIGYGTICDRRGSHSNHTDVYNEGSADKALRAKLKDIEAAVNGFASSAGVALSQNKFDALVVYSYDRGTEWMNGTGVLRSAVKNGLTGNNFLNAIGRSADHSTYARRMVEANMYLNGVYSNVKPENYTFVTYVLKQGTMAEGVGGRYIQYFDANTFPEPAVVPTYAGHVFLGWYEEDISWASRIGILVAGKTLYGKWQKVGATYTSAPEVYDWLRLDMLESGAIYDKPNGSVIGAHTNLHVFLDRDFIDAKGNRWGRLQGGTGWVLVSGVAANNQFDIDVTVTVTNSTLNGRANATAASKLLYTFKQGDKLRIVDTANNGSTLWGQVANEHGEAICWVALIYTNWNEVKDNPAGSNASTEGNNAADGVIATAVINCQGYLNVRSDAGTDKTIVGALADGDHVDIKEIKYVNGHQWGRTDGGWILLTYAKVTMVDGSLDFMQDDNVLAYTFTGEVKSDIRARKDATTTSETVGNKLTKGTKVAITTLKENNGEAWGFNGTGWLPLSAIKMDVAKYVVIADSVSVRQQPSSSADTLEKIVKGVELDIVEVKPVNATIWGKTSKYGGWVNLASKFVQRSNAPTIENKNEPTYATNLVATVVCNTTVNVRETSTATSAKLGSLSNGTVVAVWQANEGMTWYKVDSNQNGVFDEIGDGWVSASYLKVTVRENEDSADGTGTTAPVVVETGMGVVANTYTGVNFRTGAGTGYGTHGKILTGTAVEITEVVQAGAAKWGKTTQNGVTGWICMDYVTMISNYPVGNTTTTAPESKPTVGNNAGGSTSNTEGNVTIVKTPAVYTAVTSNAVDIKKTHDVDAEVIRSLNAGSNITIQELVKVTTKVTLAAGTIVDGKPITEDADPIITNTYWARVNEGWIRDPETSIVLNSLDETIYTVTGADNVEVYDYNGSSMIMQGFTIPRNAQVAVTNLKIDGAKVWGYIEDVGNGGWIQLDYLSEGAIEPTAPPTTAPSVPQNNPLDNMGTGSNVGGFVANTSGYRYTGKVINANEVNVRATPSTAAAKTTTLKHGASLVIYETTISENMAWGRCDAGWIYLYYVDLVPAVAGAVDARVVYNDNTIAYTDVNCTAVAGTYARMSVVDIYEIVGKMVRCELGWVNADNLLQ